MTQFKNAHKESRQKVKAKSRLFQKERDGFQLLLGMKMVDEFQNMDPEEFYRNYINEAAGKYQGKKGYIDQYTWGEWEERFQTKDRYATYFYGGMNDVINYFVEAYLQDDEQELTDLGYAFIPASMRFGTLPRADEELDYVQLIKRLQAVLKLSENMPPTEDISSTDKDFPGYSGQKAINTFMNSNKALIERDIQTLRAWLDDLEPDDLNQSFQSESEPEPKLPDSKPVNEDPPEPEQQDGFDATYSTPKKKPEPPPPGDYQSDVSAPASPLATEVNMPVSRESEGEIDSEEDELDLGNEGTLFNAFQQPPPPEVRRSERNFDKPRVEYSESVMAERQAPEALMKEYTLGELHQAYDQFKSDIQTLMPDDSELTYDDAKYARIYQTVGHNDPIIPIEAYKQLSDDPADDSTWTWVFPNAKLDNEEVHEDSDKISDATGLFIQFNKNAGDNSRLQLVLAMKIKEVIYNMMTITGDLDVTEMLTGHVHIPKQAQFILDRNLSLVRSLFINHRWSTNNALAPFRLESLEEFPPFLSDLKLGQIVESDNANKVLYWCTRMNTYLSEQRDKFNTFDQQIVDVLEIEPLHYQTNEEFINEYTRITEEVIPELEALNVDNPIMFDLIPEPQMPFIDEPEKDNPGSSDAMKWALGLAITLGVIFYNN